ncbi:NAD-P-binding protein [Cucurbitaria berberidis CBS 394.84]|uniref:NAD-P-binding protein n=1 Tax=Cucurbitaria berberidis CBS 394.84 TaxID=1168544 RepID=A0A9P4L4Q7_9PLEO|nr:NAD-P-binding protein [Cucurbitaria berberidis CBS 394.84]KAF1842196.1 NAD-P-binding protein [Cucurbitaria berberidis CBS 394.84]
MAPIRVGIIGLSSVTTNIPGRAGTSKDGWAASGHLPALLASPNYEIVALCNTSVKSAQAAVERHGLPSTTKTYGDPEDLAKDPDVDLVVCSVRVDRHYHLTMPSLKAGKDAFVEWPLGSNLQQAEEMLATAKISGSKTIVGLQARTNPFIHKVKDLVESKAIGNLLSSNIIFDTGFPGDSEIPGVDFMTKKEVGANFFTILFSHVADPAFYALGGLEDVSALLTTRWPDTKLFHPDGRFDKWIKRETPDHMIMHGTLSNNAAPISIFVRNGKSFKDTPNLTWRVFGTKGEIRFTANAAPNIGLDGQKIELFDHEKDAVEVIEVEYDDKVKDLPPLAKNIGALYELFATGGTVEQGLVGFEEAVGMHRIIDKMEKSSEGGKKEKIAK